MEMADCRAMPLEMKKQQEEGRKDRYIEITQTLLAVKPKELSAGERLDYIEVIADTLDVMDFQIYEWYRSLQDRMAGVIKEMAEELEYTPEASAHTSETARKFEKTDKVGRLTQLAERAIANGFLLKEHVPALFEICEKTLDTSAMDETFSLRLLYATSRSFTIEIEGAGRYYTDGDFALYVDGCPVKKAGTTVCSIFDLKPAHQYEITAVNIAANTYGRLTAETRAESCTVNVRQFGAKGDGAQDDTSFIQAAILSCPQDGRVLVPEGTYRITSLFLKSNVVVELAKGAELRAFTDRAKFPVLPNLAWSPDGTKEYCIGTWEGNPLPMFAGIITGIEVENAAIYGEGTINGNASEEDWWKNPKVMNGAFRPRLFYTNRCAHVVLQGVTLKNSPAWTIHPFFSNHLGFYNVTINNPSDSPNTDGLDPESCAHVEIAGVKFSLGDDCIAVKSGKIYMGKTYKTPSEDIRIHHCLMENGHGAVTIGSEMAGGVKNLSVEDCVFSHTDRGLRIKTRRGRGRDAVLDNIAFRRIDMDHVMTPFVVNSFYFCDPDGKTEYVQSREPYPVDDRTPSIKTLVFEDIDAKNCHVAAAYFEGLPEQKIEEIAMRRIRVTYADDPKCDVPSMSVGVEACTKRGIFARNIKKLILQDVSITGQDGAAEKLSCVDEVVR
jgi:polygalacturonase